jgi:hypothetical protein
MEQHYKTHTNKSDTMCHNAECVISNLVLGKLAKRGSTCHVFQCTAKPGHVECRFLGSCELEGFWGWAESRIRWILRLGKWFWQRGTKIGWAFGPQTIVYLYMKEKCKEKMSTTSTKHCCCGNRIRKQE